MTVRYQVHEPPPGKFAHCDGQLALDLFGDDPDVLVEPEEEHVPRRFSRRQLEVRPLPRALPPSPPPPQPSSVEDRCWGTTRDGGRCRSTVTGVDGYCVRHRPPAA
jgi:hypothetical protein